MEKKYVVKNFETQQYYCGQNYGWSKDAFFADHFYSTEDAENCIQRENGKFQIEVIYIV